MNNPKWQSVLDGVLANARQEVGGGDATKTASAETGIVKEAQETANALEIALAADAADGSLSGAIKAAQIKAAGEGSGSPKDGPTTTTGEQGVAPASGKTKLQGKGSPAGGANPDQSSALEGKMPDKPLMQDPGAKPDHSKGAGASLFELLTGQKEAADSPTQGSSTEEYASPGSANEAGLHSIMHSSESVTNATKRQAKAPTRARLSEVFAHASDTLSDKTVKAIVPNAGKKGGLKIAAADIREMAAAAAKGAKDKADGEKVAVTLAEYGVGAAGLTAAGLLAARGAVKHRAKKKKAAEEAAKSSSDKKAGAGTDTPRKAWNWARTMGNSPRQSAQYVASLHGDKLKRGGAAAAAGLGAAGLGAAALKKRSGEKEAEGYFSRPGDAYEAGGSGVKRSVKRVAKGTAAGTAAGAALGALGGNPLGGAGAGAALGAWGGSAVDAVKKLRSGGPKDQVAKKSEKKASVRDMLEVATAIKEGKLGDEALAALESVGAA